MKLAKIKGENKIFTYTSEIVNENTLFRDYLNERKTCYALFENFDLVDFTNLINYNDTKNVTYMGYMFKNCRQLKTIPKMNTYKVVNMIEMFRFCTNLERIPKLNTENVTDMSMMFEHCMNLKSIPELDTRNVTDMSYMFSSCINLQTLPKLNTEKVTNMDYMFQQCSSLDTIDITALNHMESIHRLVWNCYALRKIIIRDIKTIPILTNNTFYNSYHFTGERNSTYNPEGLKDGRIYVPDHLVEEIKKTEGWSDYADIIVPLSSLEE